MLFGIFLFKRVFHFVEWNQSKGLEGAWTIKLFINESYVLQKNDESECFVLSESWKGFKSLCAYTLDHKDAFC